AAHRGQHDRGAARLARIAAGPAVARARAAGRARATRGRSGWARDGTARAQRRAHARACTARPRAAAPHGGAARAARVGAGGGVLAPRIRRGPQERSGRPGPASVVPLGASGPWRSASATPNRTTVAPQTTIVRFGALVTPNCTRTAQPDGRVCDPVH